MVTKICPKCTQQVPVACKACPCGHVFFTARRPISYHKSGENRDEKGEVKRRRTERVHRERPDYFSSLQVNNQLKTIQRKGRHRGSNSTSSSTNDNDGDGSNSEESGLSTAPRKRGRPKGSVNKKKDKDKTERLCVKVPKPGRAIEKISFLSPKIPQKVVEKEEDLFSNLSAEKTLQYSIILAEINRKLCAQQFKV